MYTYKPNFAAQPLFSPESTAQRRSQPGCRLCGLCSFGSSGLHTAVRFSGSSGFLWRPPDVPLGAPPRPNTANVPTTWSYLVSHAIVMAALAPCAGTNSEPRRATRRRWPSTRAARTLPMPPIASWARSPRIKKGNIAMGYSRSSATLHPDIYFTGQSATASGTGTMDGENAIVDQTVATGSQRRILPTAGVITLA